MNKNNNNKNIVFKNDEEDINKMGESTENDNNNNNNLTNSNNNSHNNLTNSNNNSDNIETSPLSPRDSAQVYFNKTLRLLGGIEKIRRAYEHASISVADVLTLHRDVVLVAAGDVAVEQRAIKRINRFIGGEVELLAKHNLMLDKVEEFQENN